MVGLFDQYWAINNNENLPNIKQIAKVGSKLCRKMIIKNSKMS